MLNVEALDEKQEAKQRRVDVGRKENVLVDGKNASIAISAIYGQRY
jgi:hypothetical protein